MSNVITFRGTAEISGAPNVDLENYDNGDRWAEAEMDAHRKPTPREKWLKLQATHVVSMLPEDTDEALRVLSYAQDLIRRFIASPRVVDDDPSTPEKPPET